MLLDGTLDEWRSVDASFFSTQAGRLYDVLNIKRSSILLTGPRSIGIPARAFRDSGGYYSSVQRCYHGHDSCVPFMGFHLVLIEDDE